MSSIIEGYNYDIFISYRQKDNKGDRWVSEFVESLKMELESTFKEEISVYFDINPHDGLLETHDVDESLKDKLKCLIFIPIISRTYCDPKSFAWEHEFKAFIKQASQDQFGLKVKLPNGNVASRLIPVQIHDLYPEDKALVEKEIGGFLRNIEFIYKEPGVNRPLLPRDNEEKNLNKTNYRNQINKVANAIDEIIHSLKGLQAIPAGRTIPSLKPMADELEESKHGQEAGGTLISKKAKKWLIPVLFVALLIAVVFGVFKIIQINKQNSDISKLEKSIAVLPFVNDSPDQENTYFINGIMEEILNNLQKIKDFRVLSRTSTEQYRGSNRPTIPEIAKKLDVNYIVEGSGQKYGDRFVLRVQLLAAKNEKHLWGDSFEKEIKETSDIIDLQSQIAQSIATELKATITPEIRMMISKISTFSLTAYDLYQRGTEEGKKLWQVFDQKTERQARIYFRKALEYDSTFARAYEGLAAVYWAKWLKDTTIIGRNKLNTYLDSMLILANIALAYDDKLEQAYLAKGTYYAAKGYENQAFEEFEKALRNNPSNSEAYWALASYEEVDILKSLQYLYKAASIEHGPLFTSILEKIGTLYYFAGFPDKGNFFYNELLKLDGDSVKYYDRIIRYTADSQGDYKLAIEHFIIRYLKDSTNLDISYLLGGYYSLIGQYKESLYYYEKYILLFKSQRPSHPLFTWFTPIGNTYLQNGRKEEAEYYFEQQIKFSNNRIASVPPSWRIYYAYPLAGIYACKGDKNTAYEYLRIFNQNPSFTQSWVMLLKNDLQFKSIRNEPEFQQIVKDVEAKYQAEHERVRRWLEEQEKIKI